MCACVCVDLCVRACVCLCVHVCARVDLCVRVMTIDADGNHDVACLPRGATDDTRAGSADGRRRWRRLCRRFQVGRPASAYRRSGSLGTGLSVASIASRN